jgi:hypothetical protein
VKAFTLQFMGRVPCAVLREVGMHLEIGKDST